jgi:flavin-dependent dehydrogenase
VTLRATDQRRALEAIMQTYDVAIVGARVAGAATAMLLARAGHRVVVVDRAAYGADTLSTHGLMRGAVQQLERWGLVDRIAADAPPVHRVSFNYGGAPVVIDVDEPLYAPRRTTIDRVLADAAREAGAQVRFRTSVAGLVRRPDGAVSGLVVAGPDGTTEELHATVTVGADGMRSGVARAVEAPTTALAQHTTAGVYGYWEGVDTDGYEYHFAPDLAFGMFPTNDGQVCFYLMGTPERFHRELRHDREATLHRVVRSVTPAVADRLAAGRLVGPVRGHPGLPGWLRRPYGNGWALVGDAGYFKDPITSHGITDALRDAELLARALHDGLGGQRPMATGLADYERVRDELSLPLLRVTDQIAALDQPMPELQQLHLQLSREMQRESRFIAGLGPFPGMARSAVAAVSA